MRRGKLLILSSILFGCGARTDTFSEDGVWIAAGGADDEVGGNATSRGGAGGLWTTPTGSGGVHWTTISSSGGVPWTVTTPTSKGGAISYSRGGATWYPQGGAIWPANGGRGQGGFGGVITFPRGGRPGMGGYTFVRGGSPAAGGYVGKGGTFPFGGYIGKAGARPVGGYAGAGGYAVGGKATGGMGAVAGTISIGGRTGVGGALPMGGVAGFVGELIQACSGLVQDACQQCQCQACAPKIFECVTDVGCLFVVDCATTNSCSTVDCFLPAGACSSIVTRVGGLLSPSVTKAISMASCTVTSGCGC